MIAVDTNILVYAHREDSEWHAAAAGRITALAEGQGPWAIPWPCVHEFLAVATHPRIFNPPTPLAADVKKFRRLPFSFSSVTDMRYSRVMNSSRLRTDRDREIHAASSPLETESSP